MNPAVLCLIVCLCLVSAIQPAFHSKALHKFEPVSNFQLLHEGEVDFDRVNLYGHFQPYPDRISLNFEAYGRKFATDFVIQHDLFKSDATVTIQAGDKITVTKPTISSYHYANGGEFGSLTVRTDGLIHAVLYMGGETYQVDAIEAHETEMDSDMLMSAREHAKHGMIVFRLSDLKMDGDNLHLCGVTNPDEPLAQFSQRKLLQYPTVRWTNCFPNDNVARRLYQGFVTDIGFYKAWSNNQANVQSSIQAAFSTANLVYLPQLNVYLTMGDSVIQTATGGPVWNYDRTTTGCADINTYLNGITAWRVSTKPTRHGIWHAFTDCYPPPGTVGLAWIGTLCNVNNAAGVSSKSSSLWLTFAHETGHNFAAQHTFQSGQGTTGSIMDYGDGKLDGIYQFHTTYSKTEMCNEIATSFSCTSGCVTQAECWASYQPVCGNGVQETNEACDDGTNNGQAGSCCTSSCSLIAGAECVNGICCSNCKFLWANSSCSIAGGTNNGYCSRGSCIASSCEPYGFAFCGVRPTNFCKMQCNTGTACEDMSRWTANNGPWPVAVQNGTICGTYGSYCDNSGTCIVVTPPAGYTWVTGSWGTCSVSCGTGGIQTRTVSCVNSTQAIVSNTLCTGTAPNATQNCSPNPPVCVNYIWNSGNWSACSDTCDGGTQTRSVTCIIQATGVIVLDTNCNGTKPAASQGYNLAACVRGWLIGAWGGCSQQCGGGTQNRAVTCIKIRNGANLTVADGECTTTKPNTTQGCNPTPCPTYEWFPGNWATCPVSCGGGITTRSVVCRDSASLAVVDNSNCVAGTQPNTSQPCSTNICPVYQWVTGTWGDCSVSCGIGNQVRTVQCMVNQTGVFVADSYCTISRPATTQTCNTQLCSDFHWMIGVWSTCPVSCGGGQITRSVICHDMALGDNAPAVNSSYCANQVRPIDTDTCAEQACPTYVWFVGSYGSCPVTCGSGSQTLPLLVP